MKRLIFLGLGSALVFTMGGVGPAQADNGPHISGAKPLGSTGLSVVADGCAGCHRVHTAKSADGYLLKTTSQAELCFTCHGADASGASTDVVDGLGYETPGAQDRERKVIPGALRSGGFSFALIGSGIATRDIVATDFHPEGTPGNQSIPALTTKQETTSTHSVGTTGNAWGNGADSLTANPRGSAIPVSSLECGSCHDPHGNGNYRILKPMPTGGVAQLARVIPAVIADANAVPPKLVSPLVNTATDGIVVPDAITKAYTTKDFWQTGSPSSPAIINGVAVSSSVTPDGFIANISDWCTTCHTRYRSDNRRTNRNDAIFTYRHTTTKIDVVGTRNCITCHVAHGSNAKMNGDESSKVPLPDGTTAAPISTGGADSRLLRIDNRGMCVMCHNK